MTRLAFLAALLATGALASVTASRAAQTIVGTWAPNARNCTPVDGMISIGSRSLTADETSCTFGDVGRSGDVVTWHGRCSDGEASKPTTVVATLRNSRLSFTMNGAPNGPYRRCRSD